VGGAGQEVCTAYHPVTTPETSVFTTQTTLGAGNCVAAVSQIAASLQRQRWDDCATMVSRRRYLAVLSAAGAGIVGCTSRLSDGNDDPPSDRQTPEQSPQDPESTETTPESTSQPADIEETPQPPRRLDIRDFGAVVDGVTDDTLAVRNAIAAAEEGDTVVFPEGTTLVSTDPTPGDEAITLDGDELPANLTLTGTGYDSVIAMAGQETVNHKIIALRIHSGVEGLTIQKLRFDGQKDIQNSHGGHAIRAADANSSTVPCSVRLEDLWVQDCHQSGIALRHSGMVINRCTVSGCRKHGISVSHHGEQTPGLRPFVVRNTYCTQNGKAGAGVSYGLNTSFGNFLVENCVFANNAQGTKTTAGGIEVQYRRVRLHNNDINGYIRAGTDKDGRTTVIFDDVVANGNGNNGIRLSQDTDYYVPTSVVASNNRDDNIRITSNARIEAATVWANRSDKYGISSDTSVGGQIEQYRHFGNEKGAIQAGENVSVVNRAQRDKADISAVPDIGDVGASVLPSTDIESD
jgi:hypothetical protein